jgi:hypothetical protein
MRRTKRKVRPTTAVAVTTTAAAVTTTAVAVTTTAVAAVITRAAAATLVYSRLPPEHPIGDKI